MQAGRLAPLCSVTLSHARRHRIRIALAPHRFAVNATGGCVHDAAKGLPQTAGLLTADEQLELVEALEGTRYRTDEDQQTPVAIFEELANGAATLERLFPREEKEVMPMYFVDDGALELTHACALGNQQAIVAVPGSAKQLNFDFLSITSLGAPTEAHMHEHVFACTEKDQVDATWVLWQNGSEAERRLFPMQRR